MAQEPHPPNVDREERYYRIRSTSPNDLTLSNTTSCVQQTDEVDRVLQCRTDLDVLKLCPTSMNVQDVNQAYRRIARCTHPDRNPHPKAVEAFRRVRLAFERLTNSSENQNNAEDFGCPSPPSTHSSTTLNQCLESLRAQKKTKISLPQVGKGNHEGEEGSPSGSPRSARCGGPIPPTACSPRKPGKDGVCSPRRMKFEDVHLPKVATNSADELQCIGRMKTVHISKIYV
eukprot:PhF_6_TR19859/c0_g1_i1/m.28946